MHVGLTAFLGVSVISAGSGADGGFGIGGYGFGQPALAPTSSGVEIESIMSGSPASQAGLAKGDAMTSLGGQSLSSPDSLTTIIENEKPARPCCSFTSTLRARNRPSPCGWHRDRRSE